MIDPNAVSTIRVGELSPEPFSLTDNVPHEVGTELKRGTIEDLATFISAFIGSTDGVGFRAISVTDGQTLPTTTQQEFILVGKGTYYNVVGGSTIICTEELNAIVSNGSYWFIGVEIPINVELAGITQFIRDGFINTTPSEDVVYEALALKANVADSENIANKQNDLTPDGTGTKYLTVDAANTIDLQKVINVGGYAELGDPNSSIEFASSIDDITDREVNLKIGTEIEVNDLQIDYIRAGLNSANYELGNYASIKAENQNVFLNVRAGAYETVITPLKPLIDTTLNFPAKTVAGTYTLATTDEVVDLTTGQDIAGDKVFLNTPLFNSSIIRVMNSDGNGDGQIENNLDRYLFKNRFGYLQFLIQDSGFVTYKSPTIAGTFSNVNLTASRTFTLPDVTGTIPIVSQTITNGVTDKSPSEDAVFDALVLKSNDSDVVKLAGTQTITGSKTFSLDSSFNSVKVGKGGSSIASNTALGDSVLRDNSTGSNNTGVGLQNLLKNTTGSGNVSIGSASLSNNTSGNNNLAIGTQSMLSNTLASSNTAIGYQTILNNTTGSNNVALGYQAGRYLNDKTTANIRLDNSILIGYMSSVLADTQTNQIVMGHNSIGLGSNTTVIGNSSTIQTWLGGKLTLGTTIDNGITDEKLQVTGAISVTNTIKAGATVRLKNYTVATLPSGVQGDIAYVTDALSPTYLGVLVGGGAVKCPVFYNGTAWVSH